VWIIFFELKVYLFGFVSYSFRKVGAFRSTFPRFFNHNHRPRPRRRRRNTAYPALKLGKVSPYVIY
jgi:hypothetical protein